MTSSQLAACISALAALVAISGALMAYRARRAAERTLPWTGVEGTVCDTYQPPATAEMTGLCARCGMYDYKHQEPGPA